MFRYARYVGNYPKKHIFKQNISPTYTHPSKLTRASFLAFGKIQKGNIISLLDVKSQGRVWDNKMTMYTIQY